MHHEKSSGNLTRIKLLRDDVSHWSDYPFSVPTIAQLHELDISSQVCFFAGENGTGKSTLLEAVADNFGLGGYGGSKHFSAGNGAEKSLQNLANVLRLSWRKKPLTGYFLRAESFFNIATHLDNLQEIDGKAYASYGGKSLHHQSHGESFLSLLKNRFSPGGFYVMDEPEAALSPQRQLSLLVIVDQLVSSNRDTQFLIATHSPIILAYPSAQIYEFSDDEIKEIYYEETEAYQITSGFLNNRDEYLRKLFQTDGA